MTPRRSAPVSVPVSVLAALGVALAGVPAEANLRAPRVIPAAPSSALTINGQVAALRVLGETLRFECGATECGVVARYRVRSADAGRYAFEFLLPVDEKVRVRVLAGDPAEPVVAVAVSPLPPPAERRARVDEVTQYAARFEAGLPAGESAIEVSYRQPLAATERDYGYFKKNGRFVQHFDYLLGPLKEWTLEDGFAIDVTVTMEREAPGWWKRTFGTVTSLTCRDAAAPWDGPALDRDALREQRGAALHLAFTLRGRAFPDRLRCTLGDEDLLPK